MAVRAAHAMEAVSKHQAASRAKRGITCQSQSRLHVIILYCPFGFLDRKSIDIATGFYLVRVDKLLAMRRCASLLSTARRRQHILRSLAEPRVCLSTQASARTGDSESTKVPRYVLKYAVFNKIPKIPKPGKVDEWVALLDQALPTNLRLKTNLHQDSDLDIEDASEILLAAQYPSGLSNRNSEIDLLTHLAISQQRWPAVIWLVKALVEHFPVSAGWSKPLEGIASHFPASQTLDDMTSETLDLDDKSQAPMRSLLTTPSKSLVELTSSSPPMPFQYRTRLSAVNLDILGQIWRSLGAMTNACIGGPIHPGILEIIAHLHHKEIMPHTIYQYTPHPDPSAVQQPPLIPMLSSRVLTSLSDAAWRARENQIIEDNRLDDKSYADVQPELPGSVYRISVAGLRAEIWLELILWSCLHGGWVLQGAEILRLACPLKNDHPRDAWQVTSWREHVERSSKQHDEEVDKHWTRLDYLFKTTASSSRDEDVVSDFLVDRTLSTEVVNAYIDAVVGCLDPASNQPKFFLQRTVEYLKVFGLLLRNSGMSLSTGSWEALLVRLIDTQGLENNDNAGILGEALTLNPAMAERVDAGNLRGLSSYVLDGSAAMTGFFHRLMQKRIQAGNLRAALNTFRILRDYTDRNKVQSLSDFFQTLRRPSSTGLSAPNDNDSSANGAIQYPALSPSVPFHILAGLLNLVTEAKAYEVGRWMIYDNDLEGPIIPRRFFTDPRIHAAVIRFAVSSNDGTLLARVLRSTSNTQPQARVALMQSQMQVRSWAAVGTLLDSWERPRWADAVQVLSSMAREVLIMLPHEHDQTRLDDTKELWSVFRKIVQFTAPGNRQFSDPVATSCIQGLLVLISATNRKMADICSAHISDRAFLNTKFVTSDFDKILDGALSAGGSSEGHRLLSLFWPFDARANIRACRRAGDLKNAAMRDGRRVLTIQLGNRTLRCGGYLSPTHRTIGIIVKKALAELRDSLELPAQEVFDLSKASIISQYQDLDMDSQSKEPPQTPQALVVWAIRRMLEVSDYDRDAFAELDNTLSNYGFDQLRAALPRIIEEVEATNEENDDILLARLRDNDSPNNQIAFDSLRLPSSGKESDEGANA